MIHRLITPPDTYSYFLFGARGTGKTTLLRTLYPNQDTLFIDLLNLEQEARFVREPEMLSNIVDQLPSGKNRIVIDEVQRIPCLLNVVHRKLEERKRQGKPLYFVMTGSSARKLKRGAANLLAGRAFIYHIFPLTAQELETNFDLQTALEYGTLPQLLSLPEPEHKRRYLEAYGRTYLKEEVWNEQIIRKLQPFSNFLEIAAQMNGKILNYTRIARDIGVDVKTIQSYFQILEDTLLGFLLPPFHRSIRKRQLTNPKFYFFDTGVKRALERTLPVPLLTQTSAFGEAFEHFVMIEMHRLNEYNKSDFRFSYLRTHDGLEIDVIIERPGRPVALVEIKSTRQVRPDMVRHLTAMAGDFTASEMYCLSLDPTAQRINNVNVMPWQHGLKEIFS